MKNLQNAEAARENIQGETFLTFMLMSVLVQHRVIFAALNSCQEILTGMKLVAISLLIALFAS